MTNEKRTTKQTILATIQDSVADLMYYDRKEDERLPLGAIEEAIANGEITGDEMVAEFRKALEEST